MKFVIPDLRSGDIIEAEVTEILSDIEVIMSFKGDLLRIQNHSRNLLKLGQKVQCRVSSAHPLQFEIVQNYRPSFKMDRVI